MDEMNVKDVLSNPFRGAEEVKPIPHDPLSDFKRMFSQSIDELNRELAQADQSTQEMVLGKKDVHQAMIALEQANLSLRLLIQIRNKIISAYEEIMRIQF